MSKKVAVVSVNRMDSAINMFSSYCIFACMVMGIILLTGGKMNAIGGAFLLVLSLIPPALWVVKKVKSKHSVVKRKKQR